MDEQRGCAVLERWRDEEIAAEGGGRREGE